MADELLPCPWCGARDAHNQSDYGDENQFVCAVCDARGPMDRSYQDAQAAWNRRLSTDAEVLRRALEPFARAADGAGTFWDDDLTLPPHVAALVLVGDLRRARALLSPTIDSADGGGDREPVMDHPKWGQGERAEVNPWIVPTPDELTGQPCVDPHAGVEVLPHLLEPVDDAEASGAAGEALAAADYLISLYERLWKGAVVRDLAEAISAYDHLKRAALRTGAKS